MNIQRIYEMIIADIPIIDEKIEKKCGSQELWSKLSTRYKVILPEIVGVIKVNNKIAAIGSEFDFTPELKKLKEALTTWIWMNEENITIKTDKISNHSKLMIKNGIVKSFEAELNDLLNESLIYILKDSYREKRIGLEKIYDSFERMKTLNCEDKKKSVNLLISEIAENNAAIESLIYKEMKELTDIGNSYSIRHHETNQTSIPNIQFIEYLYFRVLSLISLVFNSLDKTSKD